MRLPRAVAKFNKKVTNPLQMLWAPRIAPWAVVHHVGRRTGREYSVPVNAWVDGSRLAIVLTYGRETDWVRNVTAKGRFELTRASKRYAVTNIRVVPSDSPDVVRGARIPARIFESVLIGSIAES